MEEEPLKCTAIVWNGTFATLRCGRPADTYNDKGEPRCIVFHYPNDEERCDKELEEK